jgi:hypothetical protein
MHRVQCCGECSSLPCALPSRALSSPVNQLGPRGAPAQTFLVCHLPPPPALRPMCAAAVRRLRGVAAVCGYVPARAAGHRAVAAAAGGTKTRRHRPGRPGPHAALDKRPCAQSRVAGGACSPRSAHPVPASVLHPCTPALLHSCTPALLHSCTPALLHSCTPALLHSCTPLPPPGAPLSAIRPRLSHAPSCTVTPHHACGAGSRPPQRWPHRRGPGAGGSGAAPPLVGHRAWRAPRGPVAGPELGGRPHPGISLGAVPRGGGCWAR